MAELDVVKEAIPSTPASTYSRIFVDTVDKKFKQKNDAGRVQTLVDELYSVVDYGADPTGVADSTAAIALAIAAATNKGAVFFPVGSYKVTATTVLTGCDVIGEALGDGLGVKIQPSAQTFSVFSVAAQRARYEIKNLMLDFSTANSGATCSNTAAKGIDFSGAIQGQVRLTNVFVQYAYYGYYDTAGSFLMTLTNCQFDRCRFGWYKQNGTTTQLNSCYVTNSTECSYYASAVMNLTLVTCATESRAANATANHGNYFSSCHGLALVGLDVEANHTTTAAGLYSIINISGCIGFVVQGLKTSGNFLDCNGGGDTKAFLLIDSGSRGTINGSTWGSDWSDVATVAGGTGVSLYVNGATAANQVDLSGCAIKAPTSSTGSPTVVFLNCTDHAGQGVKLENCSYTGTVTDAGFRVDYSPDTNGNNISTRGGIANSSQLTTCTGDFTGANSTNAQPIFNTTEDTLTVLASTSYLMEGVFHIHTVGTANHTFGILFGGGATLTDIGYAASTTNAATEVLGAEQTLWCTAATVQILTAATATATHHTVRIKGIVRINAAGTFIPQYQWGTTAPGTAGVTLKDSYFMLTPFGTNTTKAVGNWA